jgi:protein-S-isoprenylcysteine O-methyltransferase Ste14
VQSWFPNSVFAALFFLSFLTWFMAEILHHLIGKGERLATTGAATDRGSYWLLIIVAAIALNLAYLGRLAGWGVSTGGLQYIGLALLGGGIALREWAIMVLGRHFSVVVAIEENHQLITQPPYRWLRHPAYTGGFVAMLGLHLALGSWGSALLMSLLLLPAFLYRIHVEEQALLSVFGPTYQAYRQQTWRLFPGW